MKRLLILLVAFACFCAPAAGETMDDQTPDFVEKLFTVAEGELGYVEGGNNYSKYGVWSGDANAAWCAEFICWCVDQVDQRYGTELLDVVYPNYSGQNTGRDWFIRRGRFVYRKGYCPDWGYQWLKGSEGYLAKNEYIPRPGDLMFFSYNAAGDTEHVALVEYCQKNEYGEMVVHVLEGNNPDRVQRNAYLLGFGLCQDLVDTTMRFGNEGDKVSSLQQDLHAAGFLEERHITGVFGSNTRAAVMAFQQKYLPGRTATGIADRQTMQAIGKVLYQIAFESPETWLVDE